MAEASFNLKDIALPAFGPSLLYGVATGAIVPVIAFSARDLGASVAASSLVVALTGIGSLASNVPAALITSRFGERKAMAAAAAFSILAFLLCIFAVHVWMLAAGVLATALSTFSGPPTSAGGRRASCCGRSGCDSPRVGARQSDSEVWTDSFGA